MTEPTREQCCARIWNEGYGARCSRWASDDTEFCIQHNKVVECAKKCSGGCPPGPKPRWQCHGRYDQPRNPRHMWKNQSENEKQDYYRSLEHNEGSSTTTRVQIDRVQIEGVQMEGVQMEDELRDTCAIM